MVIERSIIPMVLLRIFTCISLLAKLSSFPSISRDFQLEKGRSGYKGDKRVRDRIIEVMEKLVEARGVAPDSGGLGEGDKARFLKDYLGHHGLRDIESWDAPDSRVPQGVRPNFAVTLPGSPETGPTLWIMSHLDVVPPGDASLWKSDPFCLKVEGDTLVGRGVEDNHHGLVASLLASLDMVKQGSSLRYRTRLLFVSDEEITSEYGIQHVLKQPGVFSPGDMALVPDGGNPQGNEICIAEKGILWLRVRVQGAQCHASTPDEGKNAFYASARLITALMDRLSHRFSQENPLFTPPRSTFEPTRKESPPVSINTIPGEEVFYMDCRIIPEYPLQEVLDWLEDFRTQQEVSLGVKIQMDPVDQVEASATPQDSPLVQRLQGALEAQGITPQRLIGVGGGTVASYLREAGIDAAVWSTIDDSAHQPNEWTTLSSIEQDIEVIKTLVKKN